MHEECYLSLWGLFAGPPLPFILNGWWYSDDQDRRNVLEIHIKWAHDHGALDAVDKYLRGLAYDDWHYDYSEEDND